MNRHSRRVDVCSSRLRRILLPGVATAAIAVVVGGVATATVAAVGACLANAESAGKLPLRNELST